MAPQPSDSAPEHLDNYEILILASKWDGDSPTATFFTNRVETAYTADEHKFVQYICEILLFARIEALPPDRIPPKELGRLLSYMALIDYAGERKQWAGQAAESFDDARISCKEAGVSEEEVDKCQAEIKGLMRDLEAGMGEAAAAFL